MCVFSLVGKKNHKICIVKIGLMLKSCVCIPYSMLNSVEGYSPMVLKLWGHPPLLVGHGATGRHSNFMWGKEYWGRRNLSPITSQRHGWTKHHLSEDPCYGRMIPQWHVVACGKGQDETRSQTSILCTWLALETHSSDKNMATFSTTPEGRLELGVQGRHQGQQQSRTWGELARWGELLPPTTIYHLRPPILSKGRTGPNYCSDTWPIIPIWYDIFMLCSSFGFFSFCSFMHWRQRCLVLFLFQIALLN